MTKQKLELTWIGKHKRPKLEARILLEDAEKSYHAATAARIPNLNLITASSTATTCLL